MAKQNERQQRSNKFILYGILLLIMSTLHMGCSNTRLERDCPETQQSLTRNLVTHRITHGEMREHLAGQAIGNNGPKSTFELLQAMDSDTQDTSFRSQDHTHTSIHKAAEIIVLVILTAPIWIPLSPILIPLLLSSSGGRGLVFMPRT